MEKHGITFLHGQHLLGMVVKAADSVEGFVDATLVSEGP